MFLIHLNLSGPAVPETAPENVSPEILRLQRLSGEDSGVAALQGRLADASPEERSAAQQTLHDSAYRQEQLLEGQLRQLQNQTCRASGQARALRRFAETASDYFPQAETRETELPVDSPEIIQARADILRLRSLRESLETPGLDGARLTAAAGSLRAEIDASRHGVTEPIRLATLSFVRERLATLAEWSGQVGQQQDRTRMLVTITDVPTEPALIDYSRQTDLAAQIPTAAQETRNYAAAIAQYTEMASRFAPRGAAESENDFIVRLQRGGAELERLEASVNLPALESRAQDARSFNHYYRIAQGMALTAVASAPAVLMGEAVSAVGGGWVLSRLFEGATYTAFDHGIAWLTTGRPHSPLGFAGDTLRNAAMSTFLGRVQTSLRAFLNGAGAGAGTRALSSVAAEVVALGGFDFASANMENALMRGTFDPAGAFRQTMSGDAWEMRLGTVFGMRAAARVTHPLMGSLKNFANRGLDSLARFVLPLGRPILNLAVGSIGNTGGGEGERVEIIASNDQTPAHEAPDAEYRAIERWLTSRPIRIEPSQVQPALEHLWETLSGESRDDFKNRLLPALVAERTSWFTAEQIMDIVDERMNAPADPSPQGQALLAQDAALLRTGIKTAEMPLSGQVTQTLHRIHQFVTDPALRLKALDSLGACIAPSDLRTWLTAALSTPASAGRIADLFAFKTNSSFPNIFFNMRLQAFPVWLSRPTLPGRPEVNSETLRNLAGPDHPQDGPVAVERRFDRIQDMAAHMSRYFRSIGESPLQAPEMMRGTSL